MRPMATTTRLEPALLEAPTEVTRPFFAALRRFSLRVAPAIGAVLVTLAIWELIVLSGWKPDWVLPGPRPVLARLWQELLSGEVMRASGITMARAGYGFAIALVIGSVLGFAMSKLRWLRAALSGMITGLQTMPSVVWIPFAILLLQLGESAIMFVVVLGAAPSIAVGLLSSIDHVQPLLIRVGRTLGARGLGLYRHVILPAATPGYITGLKQGWAFSWRSLMAGEIIANVPNKPSLGSRLFYARELTDMEGLMAWMIVVLVIGIVVDLVVFGRIEQRLRRERGLVEEK